MAGGEAVPGFRTDAQARSVRRRTGLFDGQAGAVFGRVRGQGRAASAAGRTDRGASGGRARHPPGDGGRVGKNGPWRGWRRHPPARGRRRTPTEAAGSPRRAPPPCRRTRALDGRRVRRTALARPETRVRVPVCLYAIRDRLGAARPTRPWPRSAPSGVPLGTAPISASPGAPSRDADGSRERWRTPDEAYGASGGASAVRWKPRPNSTEPPNRPKDADRLIPKTDQVRPGPDLVPGAEEPRGERATSLRPEARPRSRPGRGRRGRNRAVSAPPRAHSARCLCSRAGRRGGSGLRFRVAGDQACETRPTRARDRRNVRGRVFCPDGRDGVDRSARAEETAERAGSPGGGNTACRGNSMKQKRQRRGAKVGGLLLPGAPPNREGPFFRRRPSGPCCHWHL